MTALKANPLLLGLILLSLSLAVAAKTRNEQWRYTVYLDDDPVGYHHFTLNEQDQERTLRSEARFDVKVLMIKAYSYSHDALEGWRGECLTQLTATTDDNGDRLSVAATESSGQLKVKIGQNQQNLPGCIMSFAYWNPLILSQSRLLNPQTGEYTPVRIEARGQESIPVRGQKINARRYHVDAGKFQIELWYADGERWVALDSVLDNGHRLRYRLEN